MAMGRVRARGQHRLRRGAGPVGSVAAFAGSGASRWSRPRRCWRSFPGAPGRPPAGPGRAWPCPRHPGRATPACRGGDAIRRDRGRDRAGGRTPRGEAGGGGADGAAAERSRLGGTCVNYGCTPTKTLVASARAAHVARTAGRLGIHAGAGGGRLRRGHGPQGRDRPAVAGGRRASRRARRRRGCSWYAGTRASWASASSRSPASGTSAEAGGAGRGHPPRRRLGRGRTPSLARQPARDGAAALPEHLLVLGGGYIGCELGQLFRRLGARVTLVQRAAHLLDREDPEVSGAVEEVFRGEGMASRWARGWPAPRCAAAGSRWSSRTGASSPARMLVAVGRRPNTDDLGCAAGGVELDRGDGSGWTIATGRRPRGCTRWAT